MNKFIGIGRNTKDGEYRTSESGITMYSNSLAMTNNFKNKEGKYDSEFINYIAYRSTADYLNKYSKKGTMVTIEGRISTTSKEVDGVKRYFTNIVVENASVLEKKETPEEVNEFDALHTATDYDDKNIKLEDEDIDKVFNQQMELPF